MKYYNLLKAWSATRSREFTFVNSHDKASAVRDSSRRETLKASLVHRLRRSKNMLLIVGDTTRLDTDWVPFEIRYAIDTCRIPIIAAYPGYERVSAPWLLSHFWPAALASRIRDKTAYVVHVPFTMGPIADAIGQFSNNNLPNGPLSYYSDEAYRHWGLLY